MPSDGILDLPREVQDEVAVPDLSEREKEEVEQHSSVKVSVVHEAVRRDGELELSRSASALAWSGLAAGLSMSFSFIAEGLLRHYLPDTAWRSLVSKFGYSFGFLIVIIGRQQLFTENTLTAVLPVLARRTWTSLFQMLRNWTIVLAANLTGAHIMAWVLGNTSVFRPEIQDAFAHISKDALAVSPGDAVLRGIFAGWLIAMLVWMRAAVDSGEIPLIIIMTYFVAVGGFTHIIAGSIEALFSVMTGAISWVHFAGYYMLPTLLGNTLGGVSLVAVVNHAQVISGGGSNRKKESAIVSQ